MKNLYQLTRRAEVAAERLGTPANNLYFHDQGMEGVIFVAADDGVAYKVSRHGGGAMGRLSGQKLRNEAEALEVLNRVLPVFVPKFYGYDKLTDVIAREFVEGRVCGWLDEKVLWDIHDAIAEALRPEGFTAPEFKSSSFIVDGRGQPKMVDLGFCATIGKRLAARLREMTNKSNLKELPFFDVQIELKAAASDKSIPAEDVWELFDRLRAFYGDTEDVRGLERDIDWSLNNRVRRNPAPCKNPIANGTDDGAFTVGRRTIESEACDEDR